MSSTCSSRRSSMTDLSIHQDILSDHTGYPETKFRAQPWKRQTYALSSQDDAVDQLVRGGEFYGAGTGGRGPVQGGECYAAGTGGRGLVQGGNCYAAGTGGRGLVLGGECYAAGTGGRGLVQGGSCYAAGTGGRGLVQGGNCYAAGTGGRGLVQGGSCYAAGTGGRGLVLGGECYAAGTGGRGLVRGGECYAAGTGGRGLATVQNHSMSDTLSMLSSSVAACTSYQSCVDGCMTLLILLDPYLLLKDTESIIFKFLAIYTSLLASAVVDAVSKGSTLIDQYRLSGMYELLFKTSSLPRTPALCAAAQASNYAGQTPVATKPLLNAEGRPGG
ncbi:hypothetical protein AC578_129, partial [Pseudocercospora eumusae]